MDKETEKLIYDCIVSSSQLQRVVEVMLNRLLIYRNHFVNSDQKEVKPDDES